MWELNLESIQFFKPFGCKVSNLKALGSASHINWDIFKFDILKSIRFILKALYLLYFVINMNIVLMLLNNNWVVNFEKGSTPKTVSHLFINYEKMSFDF